MLLRRDVRIGVAGDFRIGLNEVAIGLTVPWFGISVARHRLARPYFDPLHRHRRDCSIPRTR